MNGASVFFDADSRQFVAGVEGMIGVVSKADVALAEMKNQVVVSFKAQRDELVKTGASFEEFQRLEQRAAKALANDTETAVNSALKSFDRLGSREQQIRSQLLNLGTVVPPTLSQATQGSEITDRMRMSALLRGGGLRAGENFASQFEIFNKISTIAFPILGAATLAAETWKGVEALKAMYDTAQKLPEALSNGWEGLTQPLIQNADGLRKSNAELDISIAKLEHRPTNELALSLAEARLNADALAASARAAAQSVSQLLEKNSSGTLNLALFGKGTTKDVETEINRRLAARQTIEDDYQNALHDPKNTSSPEQLKAERDRKFNAQLASDDAYTKSDIARRSGNVDVYRASRFGPGGQMVNVPYSQEYGDQSANVADLKGFQRQTYALKDDNDERDAHAAKTVEAKKLQDQEEATRKADEARRKAQEAQRKAAEAVIQTFDEGFGKLQQTHQVSLEEARRYWEQMKVAGKDYPEVVRKANEKIGQVNQEILRRDEEDGRKQVELVKRTQDAILRELEQADKARAKAVLAAGASQTSYDEAKLKIGVQNGTVSRQDAASQQSDIHARDYDRRLQALKDERDRQNAIDPESAAAVDAQTAVDQEVAKRKIEIMQDAAAEAATTWQGALANANALWLQDSEDTAKQVVELYQQAFHGLNSNLVDLMVGDKSNFAGMFKGIGKTLAGDALGRVEAPIMKALGLGKADGSSSNPFNVKVVGGGIGGTDFGAGLKSGLSGIFDKSGSDSDSSGVGGMFAKAGSWVAHLFGGGRAIGGGVSAGTTYLVGENGPELFSPGSSGNIIPNHALGGGGASYMVNVANGVTPEQMNMHVRQALQEFHPQVVRSSVQAMHEHMARNTRVHGQ